MTASIPDWLPTQLVSGPPVSGGQQHAVSHFASSYSLHDSLFLGLFVRPRASAVVALRWDTHWTRGQVPYETGAANWPILLIELLDVEHVLGSIREPIDELTSERCDAARPRGWILGRKTRVKTTFHDVGSNELSIVHSDPARFLCLSPRSQPIEVPLTGEPT